MDFQACAFFHEIEDVAERARKREIDGEKILRTKSLGSMASFVSFDSSLKDVGRFISDSQTPMQEPAA